MKTSFRCLIVMILVAGLCTKVTAQSIKNYETQWKLVRDLSEKRNLPKSALEEVKKIYTLARKEGQQAQQIKALVYMVNLQQPLREDNETLSIRQLEKEILSSSEPARSILKSLQAGMYRSYLQQHRYELYGRTNTVRYNKDDMATWTLEDFYRTISSLYLQSVSNTALLQQTKLEPFDAIIEKGNVRQLRPTLYDLLAHHALEYFTSHERDIRKPSFVFEIRQPEALGNPEVFAATLFTTADSLSLHHKALLLYQELTRFHLKAAKPDALIDVTLHRIEYAYQNGVMENKDSLYTTALHDLRNRYPGNPETKQATFLLARFHHQKAFLYQPLKDSTYRYERRKARELLEPEVRDSAQKTEAWANSYNLLQEINRPGFSFEVEKVNVPQQPFRILVKYKNVEQLQFRIIQLNNSTKKELKDNYSNKYWQVVAALPSLRSWSQPLPATNDWQQHAVEVKIDALPVGEYLMVAEGKDAGKKNNPVGAQAFSVSNISYVVQETQYFVLHRETGLPLAGAKLQMFRNTYDYATRRYTKVRTESGVTDQNGFYSVKDNKKLQNNSIALYVSYQQDSLNLDEEYYIYHRNDEHEPDTARKIFFFTDRSIYRPGQTVFFKGIYVQKKSGNQAILTHHPVTIHINNANGEVVDSLKLTTNDFGSVAGKFNLPQNVLNGQFSISAENNYSYFSVEEYKRPKFFVAFEPVSGSYKVGDSIMVSGTAKSYAGNNISAATVSYRVVRQPRFFYPWLFHGGYPTSEPMEITHGTVTTDENGKFSIRFKAIPDAQIDPKTDPFFDYKVYADVTDLNGETRSGNSVITAGYTSLLLKLSLEDRIAKDSLQLLQLRTENLSGTYQPSTVRVSFTRLVPEQRLIRRRYWQQPDQFLYTREEYIRYFPYDPYSNEEDRSSWQKGAVVYEKTDSTRMNGRFPIDSKNIAPGFYQLEVRTTDGSGKEVKDVRYIEVFDQASGFSKPEYLWTKGSSQPIEPGAKTNIELGTAAANVFIVQQVKKMEDAEQQNFTFLRLNNEKRSVVFTATEADRGGYGVAFFFVKNNRLYQFTDIIQVPWTNKDLKVEWSTFRDKTLPGSEERWSVKISGYKGEKAAAEMLASMYDASLDQFRQHQWRQPGLWPRFRNTLQWDGRFNFAAENSNQKPIDRRESKHIGKRYDALIFGRLHEDMGIYSPYEGIGIYRGNATRREGMTADTIAMSDVHDPSKVIQYVIVQSAPPAVEEAAAATGVANQDGLIGGDVRQKETATTLHLQVQPRANLAETAFFFPDLRTDSAGNISFSFTTPEALTTWKLQTISHTKDLAIGMALKELVTQKELMVQPNAPRFLREGDRMEFTAKIVNMSKEELTGQAQLQLFDAATHQSVDGWFQNIFPNQYFTVASGGSEVVRFPVEVPYLFGKALSWRIVASSGNKNDGEEQALPVLTNKTMVTETVSLPLRGNETKTFTLPNLLNNKSETLQHHALTVEFTTNPAWLAVQALPYLAEAKNENAEQIWNRYFAHALAQTILAKAPRLKTIFESWKIKDTAALLSNLQKNAELKSVLLEETPWVLQAKNETEQKRNIALLFDLSRMSAELKSTLEKLKEFQSENGGFVWLKGGPDDRYMTQYIVTGIGHLKQLGGITSDHAALQGIAKAGTNYLDARIREDYNKLVRSKAKLATQQPGYQQVQYLYMRSFFLEQPVAKTTQTAYQFYRKQAQLYWTKQTPYMQGMIALHLKRTGDLQTPAAILKSLKETAINHEELGMYWKEYDFGRSWYWWSAPIETHALMIEAFAEIAKDTKTVDALKTWLLKNKQTNNWKTTRATAEACYALLLQGSDWINETPAVQLTLGNMVISGNDQAQEAGTGYFTRTIPAQNIQPEMGTIKVAVQSANGMASQPTWGAVYWQYFENLDQIRTAATPLQLTKKLFVQKNSDRGPVLEPLNEGEQLQVGDKITVRIELKADRDMEYVHMKDMRAAALEPVNVLSGYKYQGGLGYYESTKDVSTQFFFDYLRKGTYVFEYSLFATLSGNFSNGITTIQSFYAPEFSAHSEGIRIQVEQK